MKCDGEKEGFVIDPLRPEADGGGRAVEYSRREVRQLRGKELPKLTRIRLPEDIVQPSRSPPALALPLAEAPRRRPLPKEPSHALHVRAPGRARSSPGGDPPSRRDGEDGVELQPPNRARSRPTCGSGAEAPRTTLSISRASPQNAATASTVPASHRATGASVAGSTHSAY